MALVYTMDTPVVGVLVYTMDTPVVGVLVYTHGHSNGGDPGVYPWTVQWRGPLFTFTDASVMRPGGTQVPGPWQANSFIPM